MHSREYPGARRQAEMIVRPEIAVAVLHTLDQDRTPDDWTIGRERDATIDRLMTAIKAGDPIDLAAPRSSAAAEHDGQSATTAGYLRGLIRDRFTTGIADFRQFVALGALAVDIEAAVTTT